MNNYQQLKTKIIAALPYLKDLVDGCEIQRPHMHGHWTYYIFKGQIWCDDNYILCSVEKFPRQFTNENIVGREPMLNDVLNYLGNHYSGIQVIGSWNLKKPYLVDQSETLISYLLNRYE